MFKLLHQCNNIIEITYLTNDQMPEFHYQCELQLQHKPSVTYFDKSFTALLIGTCGRLPQITWSASLTLAVVLGFVLSLE